MTQTATPDAPRVIDGLGHTGTDQTHLHVLDLDKRTYDRALSCVHCGLCLPACPTYTQNGQEADSPRGRIYLMKGLADGKIEPTESVMQHLDLCLDCRACETACPSGVVYHELIEETRAKFADKRTHSPVDQFVQWVFFNIFPHPFRLKLAVLPARLMQALGLWRLVTRGPLAKLMPAQLEKMAQMLPQQGTLWESQLAEHYAANPHRCVDGKPRAVVGLLAGCVGSVMYQQLNRQTIELLTHLGCEVLVPKQQGCCGAIHHHGGRVAEAEQLARTNIDVFEGKVDTVVSNIAGCGAMLHDYAHLLRDDPRYARKAKTFTERYCDISELIVKLDPPSPPHAINRTVTYHDACHLAHAQKVTDPPRTMLSWVKGLTVHALPESDMCCGAAGTYNLSQPHMAKQLAERKIKHIQSTGANVCVMGNIGCAMQIQSEANRLDAGLTVVHPVALLHEAYFG